MAQGFFWLQDKDLADKRKSGIDNLAKAIGLDAKDGSGWEMLDGYATDPTGMPMPDRQGVVCSPADSDFRYERVRRLAQVDANGPGRLGLSQSRTASRRAAPRSRMRRWSKSSA